MSDYSTNLISPNGERSGINNHERAFAAMFVDFENVFSSLQKHYTTQLDLTDCTLELMRNLRTHLEQEMNLDSIIQYAYADFEQMSTAIPLVSLSLMGVEARNVIWTQHNHAVTQLCIDAMQILYTRPDISTFVFVLGDRGYIPIIQYFRRQAQSVKIVALRCSLSGDLLHNAGEANFIDAQHLLMN